MPICGNKHRFTDTSISDSPTDIGVYVLYEHLELIYVGKGDGEGGIKSRLQSHKRGDEGKCTKAATSYKAERDKNPSARERYLLKEYFQKHKRLPRCNKRIG